MSNLKLLLSYVNFSKILKTDGGDFLCSILLNDDLLLRESQRTLSSNGSEMYCL